MLGPKLFSLFTNDLPSRVKSGSLYIVVGELYDWCILNRLTPHSEKSEAMLICKTRDIGSVAPIHIGIVAIEWVNKSCLLGTTVDDKLPWVPHMLDLKKSFAKKRDLIRTARFLPKNVLINFYFKVILPYGNLRPRSVGVVLRC